jgi:hypothetical protein
MKRKNKAMNSKLKKIRYLCVFIFLTFAFASCTSDVSRSGFDTNYNIKRVSTEEKQREDTIVFVRPSNYSILGTKSLRDYVEIMYERASRNNAGFLTVNVGFRNKGGQYLYDEKGPDFNLSVKTVFYDMPLAQNGIPVYDTNWQTINLLKGASTDYKAICPNDSANHYQVIVSEHIK